MTIAFISIIISAICGYFVCKGENTGLTINQPEVRHIIKKCSCVDRRTASKGAPRLYMFDEGYKRLALSGLSHQLSNLRAIIGEGLGMGRAVLLQGPMLETKSHNYNRPLNFTRWSDYISFERTQFRVKQGQMLMCEGALSSCVAEVTVTQNNIFLNGPHDSVSYHSGEVPPDLAASPGLIVRGPAADVNGTRDSANLLKRLGGMHYQVELDVQYSDEVVRGAQPVIDDLKKRSTNGKVAVVHARRGDKILPTTALKRCPVQLRKATSPEHIAKVLNEAGAEPGSAVYIMTDEVNITHFEPLSKLGYHWATSNHFPILTKLLQGCRLGKANGTAAGLCENYLLFLTEHEIMRRVQKDFRIETLAATAWNPVTSKIVLMHDFNEECHAVKMALDKAQEQQTPHILASKEQTSPESFAAASASSVTLAATAPFTAPAATATTSTKRNAKRSRPSASSTLWTMVSPNARSQTDIREKKTHID
jgi:hypothetical protein